MGRIAEWVYQITGRGAMHSPGAPSLRHEIERRFWKQIATGVTSERAAEAVGVSSAVGSRWFRYRGGMPLFMSKPISGRYLSFAEREEIGLLSAQNIGVREIARRIGRSPSTISRELTRNAATRGGRLEYRASVAQWKAEHFAKRPKPAKLATNQRLHHYVQERLEGKVCDADGRKIAGPQQAPFKGRNKPHRGDRKWVNGWSPEQIANRLRIDFPDDESMRISHEAIYQALYIQGRGALKRELVGCLRTGRALRVPRARARAKAWAHVSEDVMISSRPAEVEDRAVPGHWEGDLLIGLNRSAIGTLVERSSRFTMLVHLPREKGYGLIPRTKNGPALAGYGAVTMANALKKTVTDMPALLWRSLTWDRGKELSDHARFTVESGVQVFFADPHSPWQRGTNENTNGLLRQYFPKGTDLSRWSAQEIQAVAHTLNTRPRKTLGWKTPAEALNEHLKSAQQSRVATTG
ncbi:MULTISPECIES: IS30 family transposase [Burkholderia cepacia complex]|jgi:IS30 family transposase|uniref:Integrase catalytic region n=8 Tax=Burkholderia cepacia complex TaxID=87882 RepID=B1K7K3_BURO0|nr:Integrase catalytic region [Burkholderia orbicola MC0-3]ACA93403.1 Integrase catalytic region [Burkholderia orbicola MC0-3]EAY65767.1 Integrase [Burkholderia cenocepacia PC184]EAY65811.1 Integrase [Burkholderia cenocepacia PC184]